MKNPIPKQLELKGRDFVKARKVNSSTPLGSSPNAEASSTPLWDPAPTPRHHYPAYSVLVLIELACQDGKPHRTNLPPAEKVRYGV